MLSTKDPLQTQEHIQTESEGMEKDFPCKQKSKESWSGITHIRQNIDCKMKTYKRIPEEREKETEEIF